MNRFYNAALLAIGFPTLFFAIYVGFDLPLGIFNSSGAILPFRGEIFLVLGLLIAIINVRRSVRRWTGLRLVGQVQEYRWNESVSKDRITRVWLYNFLEALVMAVMAYAIYKVSPEAWFPACAYLICTVDNILFTIVGASGKKFRVGLTAKAVLVSDRDVEVIYFSGLRKIEKQQDSLFFIYRDGMQLNFPLNCIQEENKPEFFKHLREVVDKDKVYIANDIPRD